MVSCIVTGVVSFCGALSSATKLVARGVKRVGVKALTFCGLTVGAAQISLAQSGPTIPDLGIDPSDYIAPTVVIVAAAAAVAIGYKFGWKALRLALGWAGRAFRG
ncbi:MAG: hypothetical protein JNL96_28835 [Planctomycetaceae bacterium]|nr:hypothetical protein [Planctomycetaceae bacterium]